MRRKHQRPVPGYLCSICKTEDIGWFRINESDRPDTNKEHIREDGTVETEHAMLCVDCEVLAIAEEVKNGPGKVGIVHMRPTRQW